MMRSAATGAFSSPLGEDFLQKKWLAVQILGTNFRI